MINKQLENYDYYIEPCQLCISRNGVTYNKCGWCHDTDTHFKKKNGEFPGDWIKIINGGGGYPFHEIPHPTRKYFKNNKFIIRSEGALPPGVSSLEIKSAYAKNEVVSEMLGIFKSGARRTLDVNNEHIKKFLEDFARIGNDNLSSPPKLDVTGKIEFRFLYYTLTCTSREIDSDIDAINRAIIDDKKYSELFDGKHRGLCEAMAHEAFHIVQAVTTDSVGMRFDAARRLSILKWMLIEDFFLDRNGKVPWGTDAYELLYYLDDRSELYHYISRNFDYCRSDIDLIKRYSHNSKQFGLNMFDLIEGSAFVFQKISIYKNITVSDILNEAHKYNLPIVYINAIKYYIKKGGGDPVEFSLFCYCALKYGLIIDEEDLVDKPMNPVSLFGYLCSLKCEHPDFIEFDECIEVKSLFELRAILKKIGYSIESGFIKHLNIESLDALERFVLTSLKYKKIVTEIFTFLKHLGLSSSDYENLKHLISSQQEIRLGQANERLESVKALLSKEIAISDDDIVVPYLLSFQKTSLNLLFKLNNVTKMAKYTGAFGEEDVTTNSENEIIDIIERVNECMSDKNTIFCCEEHGLVSYSNIIMSSNHHCLNNIVFERFSRHLTDMIGSDSIRSQR